MFDITCDETDSIFVYVIHHYYCIAKYANDLETHFPVCQTIVSLVIRMVMYFRRKFLRRTQYGETGSNSLLSITTLMTQNFTMPIVCTKICTLKYEHVNKR